MGDGGRDRLTGLPPPAQRDQADDTPGRTRDLAAADRIPVASKAGTIGPARLGRSYGDGLTDTASPLLLGA